MVGEGNMIAYYVRRIELVYIILRDEEDAVLRRRRRSSRLYRELKVQS